MNKKQFIEIMEKADEINIGFFKTGVEEPFEGFNVITEQKDYEKLYDLYLKSEGELKKDFDYLLSYDFDKE